MKIRKSRLLILALIAGAALLVTTDTMNKEKGNPMK